MYLVVEWITKSAPSSKGFWNTGVRKVLSTATSAPTCLASVQTFSMSTTRTNGLEGVSNKMSLGFFASACDRACWSD